MKAVLVALTVFLTALAGCTGDTPTAPNGTNETEQENVPAPEENPTTRWTEIPLVQHSPGEFIVISVSAGVNALRVQVDDKSLTPRLSGDSTVDHLTYVYHGFGPLNPDSKCADNTKPSTFEFQANGIHYATKPRYDSGAVGQHLVLISSTGSFEQKLQFGTASKDENQTISQPMVFDLPLQTNSSEGTVKYRREFEESRLVDAQYLMALGAVAKQSMNSTGASYALAGDKAGTLWTSFDDEMGCDYKRDEQVVVELANETKTEISSAVGGFPGTGQNATFAVQYDAHAGSVESTVSWTYAWFEIPVVELR